MPEIRVLVVDDSAFMRKVISDMINTDPHMKVIEKARNGKDAIKKTRELKPDVVTLDIEMPGMDGLSALEEIMRTNPTPIIMLSSLTQAGAEQTVRALSLGAVDFIPKPSGQISLDIDKVRDELIRKIKIAAGTKKNLQNFNSIGQISYNTKQIFKDQTRPSVLHKAKSTTLTKLVAIGTSTGGPKALHQVIPSLPGSLDAAVLIVQHMPAGFTKSLAERLDTISSLQVKEAEDQEEIRPGYVYIAPGNYHLRVKANKSAINRKLYISLNQSPPYGGHRPSVDVLFNSIAEEFWGHMVGVVMTGMGRDGAEGLTRIKDQGGYTIAEHQSSCIVYGMPRAAVETGKVDKITPLVDIGDEILKLL